MQSGGKRVGRCGVCQIRPRGLTGKHLIAEVFDFFRVVLAECRAHFDKAQAGFGVPTERFEGSRLHDRAGGAGGD